MKKVINTIKKNKEATILVVALILVGLWAIFGACGHGNVAVVDINVVREKAKVYQEILESQKKYEAAWQSKLNAEKDLLTAEDKDLADKRSKGRADDFKKEVDAFQKKVTAFQKKYQTEYAKIVLATQQAVREADQQAGEVARQLGKKKAVLILVPKQAVLYADDKGDLTDAFVEDLDKKNVKVVYPEPSTMKLPEQN